MDTFCCTCQKEVFFDKPFFVWDGLIGDYFNFELFEMTSEEFSFSLLHTINSYHQCVSFLGPLIFVVANCQLSLMVIGRSSFPTYHLSLRRIGLQISPTCRYYKNCPNFSFSDLSNDCIGYISNHDSLPYLQVSSGRIC